MRLATYIIKGAPSKAVNRPAGTSDGMIHPFVKAYAPKANVFPWHATANDLLAESGVSAKGHSLIADLKPATRGNVTLMELTDVWGYSYAEWTPIALRLESLYTDRAVGDPERFRQRFHDEGCSRHPVHQFLYLQGGLRGGSWTWGPVGSVNGVLLWPDALKYFISKIQECSGLGRGPETEDEES